MGLPTFLQIEPVGQCNLRCTMCALQFREDGPPNGPPAFMDYALYLRMLDECPSARELQLQGLGEPLMHPRFFDMVREAKRRGLLVSTNSNATLINERRAQECVDSGLDRMQISIDGATPGTYERIRQRSHFDRVVANTHRLVQTRDRAHSRTPELQMVAVLMRQNLHELPELVRLAADLGMAGLFVQHLAHAFAEETLPARYGPMRDFVDRQTVLGEDPALVAEWFHKTEAEAHRCQLALRLPDISGALPRTSEHRCQWPWTGGYVSYQGLAMPCCMVGTPDRATLGDLRRGTFVDVWEGEQYRDFRARLDSPDPPDICRSCAVYRGTF